MLSGVILAGGRNSRMGGSNKALLKLGGEPFLARQIREMRKLCAEIVLVTNQPDWYAPHVDASVRIAHDRFPDRGPLGGMEAAFSQAEGELLWVVGCDQPFLSADAAAYMANRLIREAAGAAVPFFGGFHQMLHAVYGRDILPEVEALLGRDRYRLTDLLDRIPHIVLEEREFAENGIAADFAMDVDTPEAYAGLLDRVRPAE